MIVAWCRLPVRTLAVLLLLVQAVSTASAQAPALIPWWKSLQFQKNLGMTPDQVAKVDAIFQATLPELRTKRNQLETFETKLSNLIEADADEGSVARWVDKTEAARGSLNKERTLMLMRMRQVLTPEQRTRFKALYEEWDLNRRQEEARRSQPSASGKQQG